MLKGSRQPDRCSERGVTVRSLEVTAPDRPLTVTSALSAFAWCARSSVFLNSGYNVEGCHGSHIVGRDKLTRLQDVRSFASATCGADRRAHVTCRVIQTIYAAEQ